MECNDVDVLKNWSQAEKYELLQALKENGSLEIDQICAAVCSKSKEEIQAAIECYKRKALSQETLKTCRKKIVKDKPTSTLNSWPKFICDQHNFDDLNTETAAALRLIAEFEDRPPAKDTENIDFKKAYNTLADAMEGKPLRENKLVKLAIDSCIAETALTSNALSEYTSYRQFLKTITKCEKQLNTFKKPSDDHELSCLRLLSEQTAYNPLNIPEYLLKAIPDPD